MNILLFSFLGCRYSVSYYCELETIREQNNNNLLHLLTKTAKIFHDEQH